MRSVVERPSVILDAADCPTDAVGALLPYVEAVDIRMPPTCADEGIVAATRIRERHPGVGVLVLSQVMETF